MNKKLRSELIQRILLLPVSVARRDALETIKSFERKGGYLTLSEDDQTIYTVCQEMLLTPELIRLEGGLS